jgi:hypothetical protein
LSRSRTSRHRLLRHGLLALALALAAYLLVAYVVLPEGWRFDEERHHHPALDGLPKVTANAQGIPGGPLNVGLVGTREQVVKAILAAGWHPADPITLRSSLEIAASVVFDRPDPDAPVSSLFLFGRKQDLAFEQEQGRSADHRHHVRFWQAEGIDEQGRPLWVGSASFDQDSGLSHLTGQITHHIAPDIDAERDGLMADLQNAGQLAATHDWPGVGPTTDGHNAEGDRYETDGMMKIGELKASAG